MLLFPERQSSFFYCFCLSLPPFPPSRDCFPTVLLFWLPLTLSLGLQHQVVFYPLCWLLSVNNSEVLVIFLLSDFAHAAIFYLTAVPVFSLKCSSVTTAVQLHWAFTCDRKDGWLLIVTAYKEHILLPIFALIPINLLLTTSLFFYFQFTFSPSALLFLFICIGKKDSRVINQKWNGAEEQCCGSLRKPSCLLVPLGRPYSITSAICIDFQLSLFCLLPQPKIFFWIHDNE